MSDERTDQHETEHEFSRQGKAGAYITFSGAAATRDWGEDKLVFGVIYIEQCKAEVIAATDQTESPVVSSERK